ncbi:hypothetical protein [Arthrobacter sp. IK3]|uniref:hypothetical protein n=1 Tax=Arthrobacter sp. IK3 TaxID=3448169 RepID=UPI003EE04CF5
MAVQDETGPVLVTVYCDRCGTEETHDYLVPAGKDSIDVARRHLAEHRSWVTGAFDLCPDCVTATTREGTTERTRS